MQIDNSDALVLQEDILSGAENDVDYLGVGSIFEVELIKDHYFFIGGEVVKHYSPVPETK